MADNDVEKGQPIRTEDDAQGKIQSKIVDFTTPSQGASVTDGNLHVEMHGNKPGGTDVVMRLSQLGAPNPDGDYDVSDNTKPASIGLIVHDRNATHDETFSNLRPTGITDPTDSTVIAIDVAMRGSDGKAITMSNPFPVSVEESPSTNVHDFKDNDLAADGSGTHEFSVADTFTFLLDQIVARGSTRFKVEVELGDGAAAETFVTKFVLFASETTHKADLELKVPLEVVGTSDTTTLRLTVTNRDDDDSASAYTTIVGRTITT